MAQKQPPVVIPFVTTGVNKVKGAFRTVKKEAVGFQNAFGRGFAGTLDKNEKALHRQVKTLDQMGRKFSSTGKTMGTVGRKARSGGFQSSLLISLPMIGLMKKGIGTMEDYEHGLTTLGAKFGVVADENGTAFQKMAKYGAFLQKQAQGSIQTITDLNRASLVFAKGGFSEKESQAVIPAVRQLSTIEDVNASKTAEQMFKMSSIFDMDRTAESYRNMADVIAFSSTKTALSMDTLFSSIKKVGGTAKTFGMDFRQTASTLGLFADLGATGSTGGVALQNFVSYLLASTKKSGALKKKLGIGLADIQTPDGKTKPVNEIMQNIMKGFAKDGSTDTTKLMTLLEIFKRRSLGPISSALQSMTDEQGMLVVSDAFKRYAQREAKGAEGMAQSMKGMADAQEKLMEQTFKAKRKKLGSAFENLAIAIGSSGIMDGLTEMVEGMTKIAISMSKWDKGTLKGMTQLAVVLTAMGPALIVLGSLSSLVGTFASLAGGVLKFSAAIKASGGFISYIGVKLGMLKASLMGFSAFAVPALVAVGGAIAGFFAGLAVWEPLMLKIQQWTAGEGFFGEFANQWLSGYQKLVSMEWSWGELFSSIFQGLWDSIKTALEYSPLGLLLKGATGLFGTDENDETTSGDVAIAKQQKRQKELIELRDNRGVNVNISNSSDALVQTEEISEYILPSLKTIPLARTGGY